MPQSLSRVIVHIIFSTKRRFPFLANTDIRKEMHAYLGGTCNALGSPVIIVGGTADHVHILCALSRNTAISDLVGELKRSSSKWVKPKDGLLKKFSWQNGYGAFSIGQKEIDHASAYIENQEEHHRVKTFQEEFRSVLVEYGVEFDERYIWE